MHLIQLNRDDDSYALISYVCAYSLQSATPYIGHIHKASKRAHFDPIFPNHYYILSFDYADFSLKMELENLNQLVRDFEARARVRGLIPLIDRSNYMKNLVDL